jgi:hypothetical protein
MRKFLFLVFLSPLAAFSQQQFESRILRNVTDGKIAQYETVEIGLRLPRQQRVFRSFLENRTGQNPYAQKFLRLQFVCNGKSYTADAFYYEDATPDEKANKYVTSESEWPWRIRFAVPDTGLWRCNVLVGDPVNMAVPQNCSVTFQCVKGKNHGYIIVAPDHKHFQYSDGTSFFALGQNIGWSDSPVLHAALPWPTAGYYDVYHYINNFADNGGNYVRMVMGPWSTGIMWGETDDVYAQDKAFALDSMIRIAETRGLKVHLCLDLTTGFCTGDTKENWNPIRAKYLKAGMTCADLLKDSLALNSFDQFVRYVYSRWAFSPTVATIEIIGEQGRWEGYKGREKNFVDFYLRESNLLKKEFGDSIHLLSTSISQEQIPLCKNSVFSFIDVHHYDNDFNCNKKRFKIMHSNAVKNSDKPFFFGELGMINGPVNAADAGDYEACNDVSMHNALWATLFMGGAGTGTYWWNWGNDDFRKANYPALRFLIDSTAFLHTVKSKEWDGNGLETFYRLLQNEKATYVIGWVHNESYWWGNMDDSCKERNNKKMIHPKDDDQSKVVENRMYHKFVISGLKPHTKYKVSFYSTREFYRGGLNIIFGEGAYSNRWGKLTLEFPPSAFMISSILTDCFFQIWVDKG